MVGTPGGTRKCHFRRRPGLTGRGAGRTVCAMFRRGFLVLATAALAACSARAGPSDFAPGLPPPWTIRLDLPTPAANTNAPDPMEASARDLRDLALTAYQESRYADALALLDRMAEVAPLPPNLRRLRAWCASFAALDERAAALWAELAVGPAGDFESRYMAGWHMARLSLYREALAQFQRAIELNPGDRQTLHMLGISAWGAGRRSLAERHLVAALRAPLPPPESFFAMAAIQVLDGQRAAAMGWMRKGLERLPTSQRAFWTLLPVFDSLWSEGSPAWKELLTAAGVATNLDDAARQALDATEPTAPPPPPPPDAVRFLRLSPYGLEINARLAQAARVQVERSMMRIGLAQPAFTADLPETLETNVPPESAP